MANLTDIYKKASLVMKPAAMKEGKLYSQQPHSGAGDFTFSRANGVQTRINEHGLIEDVADNTPRLSYDLVTKEEARTNIQKYSESFDNSVWSKSGLNIDAEAFESPTELLTRSKLSESSSGQGAYFLDDLQGADAGVYTFSCFLKKGTLRYAGIRALVDNFGSRFFALVDLDNGEVVSTNSSGSVQFTYNVESYGSGWYRLSITGQHTSSNLGILIAGSNTEQPSYGGVIPNYTADGSGYFFAFGAQIEKSSSVTDYIPTEGEFVTIPAVVVASECPTLLLEPTRTNSIIQSQNFGTSWSTFNGGSISINESTSPNGSLTADKFSTNGTSFSFVKPSTNPTISTGSTTFTIFVKADTSDELWLRLDYGTTIYNRKFNLTTQTISAGFDNTGNVPNEETIEDYGNGWYRLMITDSADTTSFEPRIYISDTSSTGGDSVFLWGAQVEAGSYATSYIPTEGSAEVRNQDECGTSDTNLLINTEGTVFIDVKPFTHSGDPRISLSDGGSNKVTFSFVNSTQVRMLVFNGSVQAEKFQNITYGDRIKLALTYKNNEFKFVFNGSVVSTDPSGSVPTGFDRLNFTNSTGSQNFQGEIYQTMVFNKALSDSELITLTT